MSFELNARIMREFVCLNFLVDIRSCFFLHDAMYFVKDSSPPQHVAVSPLLHSWDGILSLTRFPQNVIMDIKAKKFYYSLSGHVTVSLSGLSAQPSPGRDSLAVDNDTLTSFRHRLCCSSCCVHLLNTEPVSFLSGMMAGPTVFIQYLGIIV